MDDKYSHYSLDIKDLRDMSSNGKKSVNGNKSSIGNQLNKK